MNDEAIKRLKDSAEFGSFQDWAVSEIEKLDSVEGLSGMSNKQAGEEAKVRAKAKAKLYEIFSPFLNFVEKKEHSMEEVNRAKKRVGL